MERTAQMGTEWARSCMQGTIHGMWWARGSCARLDTLQQAGEGGVRGRQVRVGLRVQPLRVRGGGAARAAAHLQRARPRSLHVRARRIPRLRLPELFLSGLGCILTLGSWCMRLRRIAPLQGQSSLSRVRVRVYLYLQRR